MQDNEEKVKETLLEKSHRLCIRDNGFRNVFSIAQHIVWQLCEIVSVVMKFVLEK